MESLARGSASATALSSESFRFRCGGRISIKNGILANGFSFSRPFPAQKLSSGARERRLVIAASAGEDRKKKRKKKVDTHNFVVKPGEANGPFPEAVLLKERKLRDDGRHLPEFADAEEEKLFESFTLQLESSVNFELMRHYEIVYLIHEDRVDEIDSVKTKVEEFIREKKGKIWRLNDWGLRRLAYKIDKAKNAYYVLMNIELGAKWINDLKNMLHKDERVIRLLFIKKDRAETEYCPPPPEFHTLRANIMEDDDDVDQFDVDDDDDDDRQDWNDENELGLVPESAFNVANHAEDNENDGRDGIRKEAKTLKLKPEKIAR